MKKQKKQNLLNAIITILVIALVMMVVSVVYEEKINMSKQPTQSTNAPVIDKDSKDDVEEKDKEIVEEEKEEELPTEDDEEYLGEEENKTEEEPKMTTDEKVIDLVKKEWGEDDSVTVNIEKKNGNKYRVAVRDTSTTVLQWYEVDIETWEVSEY